MFEIKIFIKFSSISLIHKLFFFFFIFLFFLLFLLFHLLADKSPQCCKLYPWKQKSTSQTPPAKTQLNPPWNPPIGQWPIFDLCETPATIPMKFHTTPFTKSNYSCETHSIPLWNLPIPTVIFATKSRIFGKFLGLDLNCGFEFDFWV